MMMLNLEQTESVFLEKKIKIETKKRKRRVFNFFFYNTFLNAYTVFFLLILFLEKKTNENLYANFFLI